MSLTVVKGLQSEIFVPVTPPPVWAPVKKDVNERSDIEPLRVEARFLSMYGVRPEPV